MQRLTEKLRNFFRGRNAVSVCCILGILGMVLILLSGSPEKADEINVGEQAEICTSEDYCRNTEARLEELLRNVNGVGDVRVMITAGSSGEYVYAVSSRSDSDRKEQDYVILKKGSEEEALIQNVLSPRITGVVVVCEGGGRDKVREEVYNTVSAVLGVSSGKIYVAQMK